MNNRTFWLLSLLMIFISCPAIALSQEITDEEDDFLEIVDEKEMGKMLEKITSHYTPWEKVEINGKLRMEGLPLSPSVKIYMEKGRKIMISLRAPFVGEVGRVEATPEGAVVVNKMSKSYAQVDLSALAAHAPVTISDLQDILLGRIFLLDKGTLSVNNAADVEIYGSKKEGYAVVPLSQPEALGASYGFETNAKGETTFLLISTTDDSVYFMTEYIRKKKGQVMEFTIGFNDKEKEATLELDEPSWEALPMQSIAIDRKYKQVPLRQILK